MQVPILKQGPYLIAAVQSAVSDKELLSLRDELLKREERFRSPGVIIDVTGLDVMDCFACRTFQMLAYLLKLREAETVIVGVRPEVAFAMVQMGQRLENVVTALDLEEGIAYFKNKNGDSRRH